MHCLLIIIETKTETFIDPCIVYLSSIAKKKSTSSLKKKNVTLQLSVIDIGQLQASKSLINNATTVICCQHISFEVFGVVCHKSTAFTFHKRLERQQQQQRRRHKYFQSKLFQSMKSSDMDLVLNSCLHGSRSFFIHRNFFFWSRK